VTTVKTPAKKTTAAKKAVAVKKAAPARKRVVRERKLGAVVLSVVEAKPVRRRKRATVVNAVASTPAAVAAPQPAPEKAARPLVAKERARRKVALPFRERLEAAMHRELKHKGPVCHPCRMNASRLAALATS
jgi:hypothetical protein